MVPAVALGIEIRHLNCGHAETLVVGSPPRRRIPDPDRVLAHGALDSHVAALAWNHERFAARWLERQPEYPGAGWRALWAITPHERLRRRCILDAIVAAAWGLSFADLARILRDCHQIIRVLTPT